MLDKMWDFFVETAYVIFIPLVCSYLSLTSNLFLNTACEEARGLEKWGNEILAPCHYLFVGQVAKKGSEGEWVFSNRFDYMDGRFTPKAIGSGLAAIPSFLIGVPVKALSLFSEQSRKNHRDMRAARLATTVHSNEELYRSYGIDLGGEKEWFQSEGHKRRPGDENTMQKEKKALAEIGAALTEAGIPWWVDCGTCLGAYRYGGVIPWDEDIDIAIFRNDFENACHALNRLDPKKYIVQDWSSREFPKSYLKIFVRDSGTLIDVYNFNILPEEGKIQYVLSLEHQMFLPEWWKIREKRFLKPVSISDTFPLKKAMFDGVEIYVAKNTKKYLQRYYGENLAPAKIYDPHTQKYEKDLSHPYWKSAYVH